MKNIFKDKHEKDLGIFHNFNKKNHKTYETLEDRIKKNPFQGNLIFSFHIIWIVVKHKLGGGNRCFRLETFKDLFPGS